MATRTDGRKLKHAVEYYAIRIFCFSLSLLPLGAATWLGRRFGDLWRLVDRRHRERAERQLMERLGYDQAAATAVIKKNFRHYGVTAVEFARLRRMKPDDFRRHCDVEAYAARLNALRAEGNGVILITGHIGNWEWNGSFSVAAGVGGGAIAKPLKNPLVNEYVRTLRERNGLRILDQQGALRKAMGLLKNNEMVAILFDQDAGRDGVFSPFLGLDASTRTVPAELALRFGSPIVVGAAKREEGGSRRFRIVLAPEPLRANPAADRDQEIKRLVDAMNEELGKIIKETPEQWLWMYRRWHTRPVS